MVVRINLLDSEILKFFGALLILNFFVSEKSPAHDSI